MSLSKKLFIFITFLAVHEYSFATNTIKDIDFKSLKSSGKVTITLNKDLQSLPNVRVQKNVISVIFKDSRFANTQENQRVTFATKKAKDTILDFDRVDGNSVVHVRFPFNMQRKEDQVHLRRKGNIISVTFPKIRVAEPKIRTQVQTAQNDDLNEDYLDSLLAAEKNKVQKKKEEPKQKTKTFLTEEDSVSTSAASGTKADKSNFSFAGYAGKFVVFLGGILLLFYFVVNLFKKGVVSRGKLGFLNNSNLIQVLSTTYIAPKKSLLLVKAHNQVFLVSNTDTGFSFLSEIRDANELMKLGEKNLTGTNFDENLTGTDLQNIEEKITLKEDITKSIPVNTQKKFSDQLKNKVKSLKPLN